MVAQLIDRFEDEIVSGRWAVGSRIPPEPALAEMVGTGRNTVREAVQVLAHSGILERRQGSGTYVLSPRRCMPATAPGFGAAPPGDVRELKRLLVYSACVANAMRGVTENIETLRRIYTEWAASIEVIHPVADAGDILSRAIVVSTRNQATLSVFDELPYISDRELWISPTGEIERAFQGMLTALFSGDRIAVAGEGASLMCPADHSPDR
ncbi:FadR/GntR family transcriptional regulator [Rhodococcus jostii]|uniref:FadR/GntR family transcriptional regulator n=1 Tax=Rhodococcus jostii TaxID=132919 RepID=UPI0009347759